MSAVDWDAMRARYGPLVGRVRVREELSDILWELQGELGTSHAYVMGGDEPPRQRLRIGLLGCDFTQDESTGRFRISAIHAGDSWLPGAHSPLSQPGVGVRVGDWLLAVNGREARGAQHPWMLLEKPGPATTLTVASDARSPPWLTLTVASAARSPPWASGRRADGEGARRGAPLVIPSPSRGPRGHRIASKGRERVRGRRRPLRQCGLCRGSIRCPGIA